MIKFQYPYVDDDSDVHNDLEKVFSDANFQIMNKITGQVLDYAVAPHPLSCEYIETDMVVEDSLPTIQEKAKAYDIIMGVSK